MDLNELRDDVYNNAVTHGWHDQTYTYEHWCMLVISEIAEAVEADRKDKHAETMSFSNTIDYALHEDKLHGEDLEMLERCAFGKYIKDTVEDEWADVVIRLLDMCGLYGINLDKMPNAFEVYDSDTDRALIQEIESQTMTEFAYSCTLRTIYICEDGISWGQIQCLLHRVYLYSVIKGFDLEWHIKQKAHYNKSRSYKHGKKY